MTPLLRCLLTNDDEPLYQLTDKDGRLDRALIRRMVRTHRLRPVKGGRDHLSAALERSLKDAVRDHCGTLKCSMSLFVNTIVADAIAFPLDRADRYDLIPEHVLKPKHAGRGSTPAATARTRKRLTKGSTDASAHSPSAANS